MIEYIEGRIDNLQPAAAVIDTGGIAYLINISLNTYEALQGKERARVLVHEQIREDAWTLYGFADERERSLFRLLIGVSGVGAAIARVALSSYDTARLEAIIAGGDVKMLKSVKGVGAKTAERIIVDLRDKIKPGELTLIQQTATRSAAYEEALEALVALGFARNQSQKGLDRAFDVDPTLGVEAAIKQALKMM